MQKPTMEWNTQKKIWQYLTDNHLFELWGPFLGTWPTSGMTVNGQVFELPMLERLTADSEFLSSPTLATPKARDSQPEGYEAGLRRSQPQLGTQLRAMVEGELIRTPSVTDSTGGARSEKQASERGQMVKTADQMAELAYANGLKVSAAIENSLMPTPTTQDNSGQCRDHGGDLLHELICGCPRQERRQSDLMPTPTVFHVSMHDEPIDTFLAREEKSSTGQIGKSLGDALRMEMFPTPVASEGFKAPAQQDAETKGKTGQVWLSNVAKGLSNDNLELIGTPRATAAESSSVQVANGAPKGRIEDQVKLTNWGKFEPAIRRWEQVIGRPAPEPTKPDGKDGNHRLSSAFTEWMMGVPEGWITGAGISRNEELKAAGNGVVPQQAELALRILLAQTDFINDIE